MKIAHLFKRMNRPIFLSAAAVLTALALALAAVTTSLCYVVSVDGQEVCTVRSRATLEALISSAEETAGEILGHGFSFDGTLEITRSLRMNTTLAAGEENPLLAYVDGISNLYLINVNGQTAGAQADAAACLRIIDTVRAAYTNENTVSCTIDSDVRIDRAYVRDDTLQDPDAIAALLEPENEASPVRLDITTVERSVYTAAVPFNTECVGSSTLYVGESETITEGRDGAQRVTDSVTYKNGAETGRETVETQMLSVPITRLVALGEMAGHRTDSTGAPIWPCTGNLTSYFGPRSGGIGSTNHKGIDICGQWAQDILAVDGGEVIYAGWMSGYGNFIQIRHDDGTVTAYAHMSDLAVSVGERVWQGQVIGYMGDTGTASAIHLHFEVYVDGTRVDPLTWLP